MRYHRTMLRRSIAVGFFLAVRHIRRSSLWSTLLIVAVMTLTFLNLVVVNGILTGLPAGAVLAYETQYTGNILISTPNEREFIRGSTELAAAARAHPLVAAVSERYLAAGSIEAGFSELRRADELPNEVAAQVVGIQPERESEVTGLRDLLIEGEYLAPEDEDAILLGSSLLSQYALDGDVRGFQSLDDVAIGSKVRVRVGGAIQDVWLKGVVESKVGDIQRRVFFTDTTLRAMLQRHDYELNEIAMNVTDREQVLTVRDSLRQITNPELALVQTAREAQGDFLEDIETTFQTLWLVIGLKGLVVASITVFIVIFVNALMRKKYIGILKGIGIEGLAIEISYVVQALFYAVVGSGVGLLILYAAIKPYFDANPIDFPFSDGLLLVPITGTLVRGVVLMIATMIAGYVPAKLIIRGNTLDAILGRS